jgi:multiple sugar transport system substrate-binding protein
MKKAFEDVMANGMDIDNAIVKKAFLVTMAMQKDYRFYFPPVFDGFNALQNKYIEEIQKKASETKAASAKVQSEPALQSDSALAEFISAFE